jgi:RNA polymerase sigma-70 factor (ECF subfamily)
MRVVDLEQMTGRVSEARAGRAEAWEALFERYQLPLYAFVFELVHHEQTSLDITQEAFINAAKHIGGLREDGKFGSWLFGIAHQKVIQHWRSRARWIEAGTEDLEEMVGEDLGADELLIREEQKEAVLAGIQGLSVRHREVVLLHFLEDFSLEEIAGILRCQLGTVKSRLHYAKKRLREMLGKDEG